MAGPDNPDDFADAPPPEVPEEFADAYREAYHRALHPEEDVATEPPAAPAAAPAAAPSPPSPPAEESEPAEAAAATPAVVPGRHRVTEYRAATPGERLRETRWFLPVLAALAVLVVVLLVWLVGGHAGSGGHTAGTPAPASPSPHATHSGHAHASKARQRYHGPVRPVPVARIVATCTMSPGVDSAGRRVGYDAANAVDGDPTTAWRCAGEAIGQRLLLKVPAGTRIAQLGLIAGYAKTDPTSGRDRYAENNRITEVRWTLAKGVSFVQHLDGSATDRSMQLRRIPVTTSGRVILEILAVDPGSRGTTAISEISVAAPRR